MKMAQFKKLKSYVTTNSTLFPKLLPALKSLSEFVGHADIKETVAKMVLFFLSQCANTKPLRRSKRKRRSKRTSRTKRRRALSTESEEEDPDYDPGDVAKMALMALLTNTLQKAQDDSSDSDEEEEDPPYVLKCREKLKLLQGHFVHTMLLGNPGTGKTTFATLLVNVWDALGIIDKRRYKITKRSDWVGKYQGHSVAKAKKLIESCKGGVIFIDEAYSIVSAKDGDDMYGREVLTEIVEAMSNFDKQVIFILAGYENEMKQLFTYNAGLERRFGYVYRFKTPPANLLENIFMKQLKGAKWKVVKKDRKRLGEFFSKNAKRLKNGGGSTKQLIFHSKQAAVVRQFPESSTCELSLEDMQDGMKTFCQHARMFVPTLPPTNMYL
jgi:adenylate kinase family enzyme